MKSIIFSTVFGIAIASCNVDPSPIYPPTASAYSPKIMAEEIVAALQNVSVQEYMALFPSLEEFHQLMDNNANLYGESLSDAKLEFGATYKSRLVAEAQESFARIIREGKEKGIVWNDIQLKKVQSSETKEQRFAQAEVTIEFSSNGKVYKLNMERALVIDGRWKVTQYVRLV